MASPPKFTENADAPLSADELADDSAGAARTSAPIDAADGDDERRTSDDVDGTADLEEREETVVAEALTRLPPG